MMSFKQALKKLVQEYELEILNDKFKTRSYLLDYVYYHEYNLIENFLLINQIFDIASIFKEKGLIEGKSYFEDKYKTFKYNMTKDEYLSSIIPLGELVCNEEDIDYDLIIEKYGMTNNHNQDDSHNTKVEVLDLTDYDNDYIDTYPNIDIDNNDIKIKIFKLKNEVYNLGLNKLDNSIIVRTYYKTIFKSHLNKMVSINDLNDMDILEYIYHNLEDIYNLINNKTSLYFDDILSISSLIKKIKNI